MWKPNANIQQLIDSVPYDCSRDAAEQSGDTQGLSTTERSNSESVVELAAEGQSFEAALITGVEAAGDSPGREAKTRGSPEDNLIPENLNEIF
jgi:hypothetical protein